MLRVLFGPLGRIFLLSGLNCLYLVGLNAGVFTHEDLAALFTTSVPLFVVAWAHADARTTGYWPAYHFGLALFAAWPIFLPLYVLRTRGRAGWRLLTPLVVALAAPYAAAYVGLALWDHVPEELWAP